MLTASLVQIEATSFADAFARRSIARPPRARRPPALHPGRHRGARRPPAAHSVRRERGNLPLVKPTGYVDVGEGPPSETILDIEHNGFRISLRDIQQDPEYAG